MRTTILLGLIFFLSIFLFQNCATCDDCQVTPAPKQVSVQSSSGDNLIFGPSAVYNPNDITIKNNLGETLEFFANITNQTIDFVFSIQSDSYFIKLNSTDTDTILFTYTKDKHIDCCNEFDATKTTNVNGKSVLNDDKITILK